jgi:hypothetical protein
LGPPENPALKQKSREGANFASQTFGSHPNGEQH